MDQRKEWKAWKVERCDWASAWWSLGRRSSDAIVSAAAAGACSYGQLER